ncbi:DUF3426 domain-containing protein [Exilibacterium tricleocarpae]|uniref:DUF3426 domain-containing protein n=1 Tax=Exilibacterium tricleocarpae TaxID=2591008 RepID=A0A545T3S5_9GAMM|nr:DUF3426 domain-containing protein [Exilibacterium tricleocarpae]TQV71854.1 DUF3426 domain-containing protein [Exilibacterium tricleocarpae]
MTDTVTRCPACSTSFRITEAQLQTAKGAVRCGSCLQIFKALDHLIESAPATAAKATQKTTGKKPAAKPTASRKAKTATTKPKPSKPAAAKQTGLKFDQAAIDTESEGGKSLFDDIDDDTLISDDMDLGEEKKAADPENNLGTLSDSFLELERWQPDKKSLFDREINDTEAQESDTADESWAIDLLEELEDEEPESAAPAETDRFTDEFNYDNGNTFAALEEEEEPVFEAPEEQGWKKKERERKKKDREQQQDPITADDHDEFELALEEVEELDDSSYQQPAISLRAHQSDRAALLSGIEPAPVEMAWDSGGRFFGAKLRWGMLATVAGLIFIIQLGWSQFDRLSRVEPYRAWYSVACSVFGCRLPNLVAQEKIRAYNLVVRSHPKAEEALVVDTILLNTATFEQPFPNLVLRFSKLDGSPVAARMFTPREYLGGELAGRTQMPSGQPVHLSLEIVDPGRAAVNYSIAIAP